MRITEKDKKGTIHIRHGGKQYTLEKGSPLKPAIERLYHYEEAYDDGLLIELPAPLNSEAFFITKQGEKVMCYVAGYKLNRYGFYIRLYSKQHRKVYTFAAREIGKTVHL